jgi:hypothetical protein
MSIESLNSIGEPKKFTWCRGCESVQISNNLKHDKELKLIGYEGGPPDISTNVGLL